jgi:hypothetical protein
MNVGSNGGRYAFLYMFLEADFLTQDYTTQLTRPIVSIDFTYDNQGGNAIARAVIKDGTDFYVSQNTFSVTGFDTMSIEDTLWAAYDPFTDLNFDQSQTFAAMSFSNITGVGVYLEDDNMAADSNAQWRFREFSTIITMVPEPTSFAFIALGGLALLGRRRRVAD